MDDLFRVVQVTENISAILTKENISQAELARRMGVARSTLWSWYTGKSSPNVYKALSLAQLARSSPGPQPQ